MADLRHLPNRVTLRKLQRDAFGSPTTLSEAAGVPALVQVRQVHTLDREGGTLRHEGTVFLDPTAALDPAWPDWEIDHGGQVFGVQQIARPADARQGAQSHFEVAVR